MCPVPVFKIGIAERFGEVGSVEHLANRFGLTAENIACTALKAMEAKSKFFR